MKSIAIVLLGFYWGLGSIKTSINQKIETVSLSLIENKLKLTIPMYLKRVGDAEIANSYSMQQRPTYLFEDSTKLVKLAINYGASNATNAQLPAIKSYFEKNYKNLTKDFVSNFVKINGREFIIMEFRTIDVKSGSSIFNYMFITTLDGKLLMMNYSNWKKNQKEGSEILNSISIIE